MSELQSAAARLVEREFQLPVTDINRIDQGDQNAVFRVDTVQHSYSVRMSCDGIGTYRKEEWAIGHAERVGVATPKVLWVGMFDGSACIVMDWIEGVPGNDYTGDRNGLYETLGRYAACLGKIPISGYGWDFKLEPQPHFTQTWREAVEKDEAYIFSGDTLSTLGFLDDTMAGKVRRFMHDYALWDLSPALSHNDICLDNVILGEDGEIYLIDWSNACAQPAPLFEIARVASGISSDLLVSFVKGYGLNEAEWQDIRSDVEKLKLVHSLRAVVWAARDAAKYLDDFVATARNLIEAWPK